jgi:hypothetical protein
MEIIGPGEKNGKTPVSAAEPAGTACLAMRDNIPVIRQVKTSGIRTRQNKASQRR